MVAAVGAMGVVGLVLLLEGASERVEGDLGGVWRGVGDVVVWLRGRSAEDEGEDEVGRDSGFGRTQMVPVVEAGLPVAPRGYQEEPRRSRSPSLSLSSVESLDFPLSPHREQDDRAPLSSQPYLHHPVPERRIPHASGLLGPSPMPTRHSNANEWSNLGGKGFYRYQQKLEAASE